MAIAMIVLLAGCSAPARRATFDSDDPSERSAALVRAAATDDTSSIGAVIEMLDSGDPVVRMLAGRALLRMTGETMGYDYAAPSAERALAVARWREWYAEGHAGPSGAADAVRPLPYNPGDDRAPDAIPPEPGPDDL